MIYKSCQRHICTASGAGTRLQHILLTHSLTCTSPRSNASGLRSATSSSFVCCYALRLLPRSQRSASRSFVMPSGMLMGRRVHKAAKIAEIELLRCIRSHCPSPQAHLRSALSDCSSSAIRSYVGRAPHCKAKLMRFWPTISIISGLKLLLVWDRSNALVIVTETGDLRRFAPPAIPDVLGAGSGAEPVRYLQIS